MQKANSTAAVLAALGMGVAVVRLEPNPVEAAMKLSDPVAKSLPEDVIGALAKGNFGALRVANELKAYMWEEEWPTMAQFLLDNDIASSRLWLVYKDLCGEDIGKTENHLKICKDNSEMLTQLWFFFDEQGYGKDSDFQQRYFS